MIERNEKFILAYNQACGGLQSKLGEYSNEFFSLLNEIVERHDHKKSFNKINNKYTVEGIIINNLEELLEDITVISGLKQSGHYKEFAEKIDDIITTYNNSKLNSEIVQHHTASPLPIIKAKLTELDKWCEETAKKDNSQVFKNIGKVIKHSLNAVVSIIAGDMQAFKKEKDNIRLYMDGIKNTNKNTIDAIKKVQNLVKEHTSTTKQPQKNKPSIGR